MLRRDLQVAARHGLKPLAVIAKHAISYGDDPEMALECLRDVAEGQPNYRLHFDQANLSFLMGDLKETRQEWRAYMSEIGQSADLMPLCVAPAKLSAWDASEYEVAVAKINKRVLAAFSVFSQEPLTGAGAVTYVIEPRLFNPLHVEEVISEGSLIPVSEELVKNRALYVSSTQLERPDILGVPVLGVATLLARAGMTNR